MVRNYIYLQPNFTAGICFVYIFYGGGEVNALRYLKRESLKYWQLFNQSKKGFITIVTP